MTQSTTTNQYHLILAMAEYIRKNPKSELTRQLKNAKGQSEQFKLFNAALADAPTQPSHVYSKTARQSAFNQEVEHLSAQEAVARASLFPSIDPSEFRIIRMPG